MSEPIDNSYNQYPDYDAINEDWKANEGYERLRAERDNLAARLETTTRERDALAKVCEQILYLTTRRASPPSEVYAMILELVVPALALVKAGRE